MENSFASKLRLSLVTKPFHGHHRRMCLLPLVLAGSMSRSSFVSLDASTAAGGEAGAPDQPPRPARGRRHHRLRRWRGGRHFGSNDMPHLLVATAPCRYVASGGRCRRCWLRGGRHAGSVTASCLLAGSVALPQRGRKARAEVEGGRRGGCARRIGRREKRGERLSNPYACV